MNTIYDILGTILPFSAYQFNFMKNAFLAILLLTPLLGLLGTMAVNHQMAFFSDALGHSALTGIGLGIILGLRNDLVAMLVFGIIWAILICLIKQSGSASTDTVISVFSSTAVAAGLLIRARGGKFAKYSSLLIGDILAVTPQDLFWLLLALVVTLVLWALLYNPLLLTSVDPWLARSRGIRTRLVEASSSVRSGTSQGTRPAFTWFKWFSLDWHWPIFARESWIRSVISSASSRAPSSKNSSSVRTGRT